MTDDGIVLLKYWLEVSPGEQTRPHETRHDQLHRRSDAPEPF